MMQTLATAENSFTKGVSLPCQEYRKDKKKTQENFFLVKRETMVNIGMWKEAKNKQVYDSLNLNFPLKSRV